MGDGPARHRESREEGPLGSLDAVREPSNRAFSSEQAQRLGRGVTSSIFDIHFVAPPAE